MSFNMLFHTFNNMLYNTLNKMLYNNYEFRSQLVTVLMLSPGLGYMP